jgi:hypothetical protein
MPVTITRKPQVVVVAAPEAYTQLSLHAALIDKVGAEAAQLEVIEAQIKNLQTKAAAMKSNKDTLLKLLNEETDTLQVGPDDQHIAQGEQYYVELGAKKTTREIADKTALRDVMGEDVFMACATVKMTDIDQYLDETEKEVCLKINRGKREGKVLTKLPAKGG